VFWRFKGNTVIRKDKLKLLVMRSANKKNEKARETFYLFDLEKDLSEENNLADTMPEMVKELAVELAAWEKDVDTDGKKAVTK